MTSFLHTKVVECALFLYVCFVFAFGFAQDYGLALSVGIFLSTVGDSGISLWYPESSLATWCNHGRRFGLICPRLVVDGSTRNICRLASSPFRGICLLHNASICLHNDRIK